MAVGASARAFVQELFEDLGGITLRAMMGGLAIYSDGRIFALMTSDERVWLKAAGAFADRLAAEGSEQFRYARRDGVTARMGYWSLPDAALDDPEAACEWARSALAAAG
ncbi:MAG: TfoX/Sxy family protein [Amaricoccus sp.]